MTHILLSALLSWLFVEGFYAITRKGMLLERISALGSMLPPYISKPIVSCPVCMCSFWSAVVHVSLGLYLGHDLAHWCVMWPLVAIVAAGITSIASNLICYGNQ